MTLIKIIAQSSAARILIYVLRENNVSAVQKPTIRQKSMINQIKVNLKNISKPAKDVTKYIIIRLMPVNIDHRNSESMIKRQE
ncbi:hypothetical protein [Photobacterium sp. Hal280]|uniref:hypothetical protein n=1 Tax=Photobacterium sp. Hal280 TaxID=3035163 RepID=UPI00301C253D